MVWLMFKTVVLYMYNGYSHLSVYDYSLMNDCRVNHPYSLCRVPLLCFVMLIYVTNI